LNIFKYPPDLNRRIESLQSRYNLCLFVKTSLTVILPYIYTLFIDIHKLSRGKIAILYLIEILSRITLSNFVIKYSDNHGRRFTLQIINLSIILNLFLRIKGNIMYVYLAQILSGIASGSSFIITQNMINSELEREWLENKKEEIKFKGRIMKKHKVLYLYYTLIILIICAVFCAIFWITDRFG